MGNEDHLLARTAVLAGEIMLVSGAEIARIEDTIHYILGCCPNRKAQTMVFSTGIFVSLDSCEGIEADRPHTDNRDPDNPDSDNSDSDRNRDREIGGEAITLIRRVNDRSTNLGRIYLVNEVSRKLCSGVMTPSQAYDELERIRTSTQYKKWLKSLSYMLIAFFFGVMLDGSAVDCVAAAVTGGVLGLVVFMASRIRLNDFCTNVLGAFSLGTAALMLNRFLFTGSSTDIVIISAVMPLVPGVIFTTAVRDTLNGDYSSGAARMLEAIVTALAVAAGVGASMALFHQMTGGGAIW